MTHTPGPWIVVGNYIQTAGTDRQRKTIAQVRSGAFEDSADARLIAAAPRMYGLLVKAHKDLCGCQTMGDDCGWPDARDILKEVS